ncbi:MAG TPA: hypothetical protein VIF43_04275 [Patescibacteria group bacterium]|jgi:hypothetical protein
MAYPAYMPFQAPYRARLPERALQLGITGLVVAVGVPLAIANRLQSHRR